MDQRAASYGVLGYRCVDRQSQVVPHRSRWNMSSVLWEDARIWQRPSKEENTEDRDMSEIVFGTSD